MNRDIKFTINDYMCVSASDGKGGKIKTQDVSALILLKILEIQEEILKELKYRDI